MDKQELIDTLVEKLLPDSTLAEQFELLTGYRIVTSFTTVPPVSSAPSPGTGSV